MSSNICVVCIHASVINCVKKRDQTEAEKDHAFIPYLFKINQP